MRQGASTIGNAAEYASAASAEPTGLAAPDKWPSVGTEQSYFAAEKANRPHSLSAESVAVRLGSSLRLGLSEDEAVSRLGRDGPNTIKAATGASLWQLLVRQFANALTLVLVAVASLSFAISDYIEGGVVVAVILLNVIVGLVQDYGAEQTIQALYALSSPRCRVIRDGHGKNIKAETLVVGDLVWLVTGDLVPADLRLVHSVNLVTDEAHLTGEPGGISKSPDAILDNAETPVGDRTNLAFSGSSVIQGRATGLVVATGMLTEVGQIAAMLRREHKCGARGDGLVGRTMRRVLRGLRDILGLDGTPLEVALNKFALLLFALAILLAVIVFSVNLWQLSDQVLLYGICVGVAVIPESLLAVLTLTVAVASKAMTKSHVIVRQMPCLEAVGGVTNICSDKTGTLTQGRMITHMVWLRDGLTGTVREAAHPFDPSSGTVCWSGPLAGSCINAFLDTISFCNHAAVSIGEADSGGVAGEPTEIALRVFAMRFSGTNMPPENLVAKHPFDSSRKLMSVVCGGPGDARRVVHAKGAVEAMLPLLDEDDEIQRMINDKAEELAASGLRVLCIADKILIDAGEDAQDRAKMECGLRFLGLTGLCDPPRPKTAASVLTCQQAGISVHMVTGDHVKTATAIAYEVGILSRETRQVPGAVMSAADFTSLSDEQVDAMEALPAIVARCSPLNKVRLIQALHRREAFCAMTGDGVNDSPALKQADVGIAMGDRGSDVAKESSDIVFTDDKFASIVTSIREGRRLADNINKFLLHLLTSNLAQVILLLAGLAFTDKEGLDVFPLSPLAILWANLVTSSPLALGLGLEEAQPDILKRPPRSLRRGVFTLDLVRDQLMYGIFMGSLSLAAFMLMVFAEPRRGVEALPSGCNTSVSAACETVFRARGTTFTTLSLLLLALALEVKSPHGSLFAMGGGHAGPRSILGSMYRNKVLFCGIVFGFLVTIPILYVPFLNTTVFKHKGLSWEWAVVLGCVATYVTLVESWKAVKRRFCLGTEGYQAGL